MNQKNTIPIGKSIEKPKSQIVAKIIFAFFSLIIYFGFGVYLLERGFSDGAVFWFVFSWLLFILIGVFLFGE